MAEPYEPEFWDIGDERPEPCREDQEALRKFVDENVGDALKESWGNVTMMFILSEDDEPKIMAWADSCHEFEDASIKVKDITGWEAEQAGSAASRRLADVLIEIAVKARMSADEWDKMDVGPPEEASSG